MKTLIVLILCLVGVLATPTPTFAAWTAVGGCAFGQASTDTNGFTTSGASCDSTGATAIFVSIGYSAGTSFTLTSSTGGTKSCGAVFSDSIMGGPFVSGQLCVFEVPTGASGNTFTLTCTGCAPAIAVKAFSGSTDCQLIDQVATVFSNFDTSISSNGISAAVNNLLVIEVLISSDSGTPFSDSVFTGHDTYGSSVPMQSWGAGLSYAVVNIGGPFATTWTNSGASFNLASASSFFATGTACPGAPTSKPTLLLLGVGQ